MERRVLMPHQVTMYRWGIGRRAFPLFAQMRLGKSVVAARWARSHPRPGKVLVVTELAAVPSWSRELALEGIEHAVLTGTSERKAREAERRAGLDWFVTNWDGLVARGGGRRAEPTWLARLPWGTVVADESTRVRSPRAKVTQVALGYLSQSDRVALLTGLPNPEGPGDYVCQMLLAYGEFMGCRDYWSWRARWCRPAGPTWAITREGLAGVREAVREGALAMTRQQAGLHNRVVRETRHVRLPARVAAAIRSAERDFEVAGRLTNNRLAVLAWCAQLAGGRYAADESLHHDAKVRELASLASGELRGEPLVVWARHTAELHAAVAALRGAGRRVDEPCVGGRPEENAAAVARFQAGRTCCIVAQPKCMRMGVDLSRADTSVYMSRYHEHEPNAQSEERVQHPRKRAALLVVDIVAEGTVDEDIAEALRDKRVEARAGSGAFLRDLLDRARRRISSQKEAA